MPISVSVSMSSIKYCRMNVHILSLLIMTGHHHPLKAEVKTAAPVRGTEGLIH